MEASSTRRRSARRSGIAGPLGSGPARGAALQLLMVLGAALLIAFIVSNTIANLQQRGLAFGYGFLFDTAAFDINQRLIPYSSTSTYGRAFLVGGLNTVLVAALGIVAATAIGFLAGVLRLSSNFLVSRIVTMYVEFTRNVPLLLQIIFWWVILLALPRVRDTISIGSFAFLNNRGVRLPAPVLGQGAVLILIALAAGIAATVLLARWARARQEATGRKFPVGWTGLATIVALPLAAFFIAGRPIGLDMPEIGRFNLQGGFNVAPELVALWIALATYTGAFISENVRAGILSVSKGQTEAAGALGLPPGLTLRQIILPQALRAIIPPLTSQYLNLTKNSSLAIAIGYQDLVSVGNTILNQSGQALEVVSIYMLAYLCLSLLTSLFMNWYNRRIALTER